MAYPYTALIEGKKFKINGMDANGKYLLGDGRKLWVKALKKESFRALKVRQVSKLTFTGGEWLLDGENLKGRYIGATIQRPKGAARTRQHTYFHLLETLNTFPAAVREKINGVAFFRERYDAVGAETEEDCAVANNYLDGICVPGKRRPLPPAKKFKLVFLADFQVQPARSSQTAKAYEAIIEGRKVKVIGFGENRKLILANGQQFAFEPLNYNPPGQRPADPSGDIFGLTLLEVVKLQEWQNDWKWNGQDILLSKWILAQFRAAGNKHPDSDEYFRTSVAKLKLEQLPRDYQERVRGVAWFSYDDGAEGLNSPVFLSQFRQIAPGATPRLEVAPAVPEYFVTIEAAAQYAKRTTRTIKNWKKRGWLSVEQIGKKIRIAKTELDKCINKQ